MQLENGALTYLDSGVGHPLVMLHGALANANTWRKLVPLLDTKFRCIQPDLPIGGHSIPLGQVDLTPEGISGLLAGLTERLGINKYSLLGNDTGAVYAQVHATAHAKRLDKLLLTNGDALDVFPPEQFKRLPQIMRIPGASSIMALLFRSQWFAASDHVLGLLSKRLDGATIKSLYLKNFIRSRGVRRDLSRVSGTWSTNVTAGIAPKLAAAGVSTTLLWACDDKLFPMSLGQRLAEVLSAPLIPIKDSSTYVQEDQPEELARQIHACFS